MIEVRSVDHLRSLQGREYFGDSEVSITQEMIDGFGLLTDDQQWIHTDTERAQVGPYGGTVAHGLFILGLIPSLFNEIFHFAFSDVRINYGFDKVRFVRPLRSGASLCASAVIESLTEKATVILVHSLVQIYNAETKDVVVAAEWIRALPR